MKSFEIAELYCNTDGMRGEKELRAYIAGGGDINEQDKDGVTAGHIAVIEQNEKLADIIWELRGSFAIQDNTGKTAYAYDRPRRGVPFTVKYLQAT